MNNTEIIPVRDLEQKVGSVLDTAKVLIIRDQQSYEKASRFVLDYVNPVLKEIAATFDPIIEKAHQAHKEALAQKNRHAEPLEEAKRIVTSKAKAFEDAQRRIQAEAQRQAEEEARKREEEERIREAQAAEQSGAAPEEVDAILETPLPVAPVHTAPTFQRGKGLTRERLFSAQVTSKLLLVKFVAENPQYLNLLEPNMPALNALARAQQNLLKIPGVQAGRF